MGTRPVRSGGLPRVRAAGAPGRTAAAVLAALLLAGAWWFWRPAPAGPSPLAGGPAIRGAMLEPRWTPGLWEAGPGPWRDQAVRLRQSGFHDWFVPAVADGRPGWPGPLDHAAAAAAEAGLGLVLVVAAGPDGPVADPAAAPALRRNPEEAMVSRLGASSLAGGAGPVPWAAEPPESAFAWGSWCAAEVRQRLVAAVLDAAARVPAARAVLLEGLAFPGPDFDFGPACTAAFEAERGWSVEGATVPARADYIRARHAGAWEEFRAGQVTTALRLVRRALEGDGPALAVAVHPDPVRAYRDFGQDWPAWVREGLVDGVVPVFTEPDPAAVARWLDGARELVADAWRAQAGDAVRRRLGRGFRAPGFLVALVVRPDAPPAPETLAAAIAAARNGGAAGVVLRPAAWLDRAVPEYGPAVRTALEAWGGQ